ncbi:MAG TPA: divalent-cation tolerance protein CutA [Candidatus Acidoferrum sp.]|nr:divalent-cation tolerance protein CutA [Candidatus Acidoferrum sp.]
MPASAKPMTDARLVLVTVDSLREGRRIANSLVKKRLAACVNILLSPVNSIYRWKEEVEVAHEYILLIKTTARVYPPLEKEIAKLHRYDVPEIIALPIAAGLPAYLAWLRGSVA